jgi:trimeric autotransporter adhesin
LKFYGDNMIANMQLQGWSANIGNWRHRITIVALMIFALLIMMNAAHAAVPLAGTPIGNQASATYTDLDGNAQPSVQSNTVVTKVAQVASFTLTSAATKITGPGGTVYFPHTLTNTGNGTDTFNLSVANNAGGSYDFTGVTLYADANGDGLPDNFTPLSPTETTGPIAPGATFKFVAVSIVPITANPGEFDAMTVTAIGNALAAAGAVPPYAIAAAQTNVDTVNISAGAVVSATKSMSALTGADGSGPFTITLTYTNSGNAVAPTVLLVDTLPAGMAYVAGSGRWSTSGATALTDATLGDPAGIAYDFNVSAAGRVTATVANLAQGVSGTVSFQVTIPANTPAGTLQNTAGLRYDDGTGTLVPGAGTFENTNTVAFVVKTRSVVVLDDVGSVANGVAPALGADSNATADVVGVLTAPQGATVQFDNVVHNNGTTPDSYDMSMVSNTFPAGTSFQFYKADGVTPLTDSNGNGIADTGTVAIGGTYHVIVKAVLPGTASGNNGGAGFTLVKKATSFADPTISDTVTDKLDAITGSTVDVTNNVASPTTAANGEGNTGTTVITTNTVDPGVATTFVVYVKNKSTVADSYDLTVTSVLPLNWTVLFKNDGGAGNCSTTSTNLSNTGVISPNTSKLVCLVVSVPATGAGAIAATTNISFMAKSATSLAFDVKTDAVTVNTKRNVTLTPNNAGQAFPGGSITYTHTISNGGNVVEQITTPGTFIIDSLVGWSSVMYEDSNGNGVLDPADIALVPSTSFPLNPFTSVTVFTKVFAPSTAAVGQIDATSMTVTYTNTSGVPGGAATTGATDTTTVISGNVGLLKEQGLDVNCNGSLADAGDIAFRVTDIIDTNAVPGSCIRYRITVTNKGTVNVANVVLNDATPFNTVYNSGNQCFPIADAAGTAGLATTQGTVVAPGNCAAGSVKVTVGTMTPSQAVVVTFGVQINKQ